MRAEERPGLANIICHSLVASVIKLNQETFGTAVPNWITHALVRLASFGPLRNKDWRAMTEAYLFLENCQIFKDSQLSKETKYVGFIECPL